MKGAADLGICGRMTSWSFSRWVDHGRCPRAAGLKHVRKLQEPKNAAMNRGGDIHELAARFLRGELKGLPAELTLFRGLFETLRDRRAADEDSVLVEESWSFTDTWEQTTWDDWDRCWLRIKVDCAVLEWDSVGWQMDIRDWKTGKFRESERALYERQLELYALGALLLYPEVQAVRCWLVYLDTSTVWAGPDPARPTRFARKDLDRLKRSWTKATLPMLNDGAFPPTPGDHCRWCWFGQSARKRGGPGLCEY